MGTCVNCKYAGRPTYKSPCSECKGYSKHEAVEIRTHGDRIRAMSDEELADWLAMTQIDNVASALKIAGFPFEEHPDLKDEVKKDALEWLKQPPKGE